MTKFIILATQRTGSTFLWRYLNSHPQIRAHGEVFYRKDKFSYREYYNSSLKKKLFHFFFQKKVIFSYLDEFFVPLYGEKAIGFKLMYSQLKKYPSIEEWIFLRKPHIIHLIRKNVLKIIVSRETAKLRKLYHLEKNSNMSIKPIKVTLDPKKLIKEIKEILSDVEKHRKKYAQLPFYLEIKYEDFFQNKEKNTKKILEFLNVKYIFPLEESLKKINPDSLKELIENYTEVVNHLKGTPYEKYLYS